MVTKTPFIVVLTTLIGLFGGLVKILHTIVPLIIGFVRRQKNAPVMQPLRKFYRQNKIGNMLKIERY
jgi:hypothetical protein